jgi:hypothetical protein
MPKTTGSRSQEWLPVVSIYNMISDPMALLSGLRIVKRASRAREQIAVVKRKKTSVDIAYRTPTYWRRCGAGKMLRPAVEKCGTSGARSSHLLSSASHISTLLRDRFGQELGRNRSKYCKR